MNSKKKMRQRENICNEMTVAWASIQKVTEHGMQTGTGKRACDAMRCDAKIIIIIKKHKKDKVVG